MYNNLDKILVAIVLPKTYPSLFYARNSLKCEYSPFLQRKFFPSKRALCQSGWRFSRYWLSSSLLGKEYAEVLEEWFPIFCFPGTPSLILKISADPLPSWNCSFAGFIASLLKISPQKMHSGLLCSVRHGIKPNFKCSTLYPRSLIFPVADRFELMINFMDR